MTSIAEELTSLREGIGRMASQVESRIHAAIDAWLNHSSDLADSVRYADDEIDQLDLDLEQRCLEILVRHQPVAGDMRFIVTALRHISSLERMADLARSISKRVMKIERGQPLVPPPVSQPMAESVRAMISDVLRALRDNDSELAASVRRADRTVDKYNREVFKWAAGQIAAHPDQSEDYLNTLILCRSLERIGDMAANMAEDIIFAVEGDVVRHSPA